VVSVSLSPNGRSIGAIQFKITFPSDKLTFKEIASGSAAVGSGYSAAANEASTGVLSVTVYGITDKVLGAGPIADVKFTVKTGASGSMALVGSEVVASDLAGLGIDGETITNGSITVGTSTGAGGCEDINRDSAVNVLDLRRVVNVILGRTVASSEDVNLDGEVNVLDLRRVVNVILGRTSAVTCP
jgi:hypothetical protein